MYTTDDAQQALDFLAARSNAGLEDTRPIQYALDRLRRIEKADIAINREVLSRELFAHSAPSVSAWPAYRSMWDGWMRDEAEGGHNRDTYQWVVRRYREHADLLIHTLASAQRVG